MHEADSGAGRVRDARNRGRDNPERELNHPRSNPGTGGGKEPSRPPFTRPGGTKSPGIRVGDSVPPFIHRLGMAPELRARWDHAGLASGHAWARCDVCGEEMMLPRDSSRRCALSFGCAGTMRVPSGRPTPLQALRSGAISVGDIRRWPPVLSPTLRKLIEPLETEPPEKCPPG